MKKIINKYFTLIKYIFSSGASFIIDITLFTIFNLLFHNIIYATILARVISSLFNYLVNRKIVFKNDTNKVRSLCEYFLLVVMQMLLSGYVVDTIHSIVSINATLIKVPVEILLFMFNYVFQKHVIFSSKRNNYSIVKSIILSVISVIAVVGNLKVYRSSSYIEILKSIDLIVYVILLIFFFFIYNNLYKEKKLPKIYNIFILIISFLIVLFCSYNHVSNASMICYGFSNVFVSLIKIIGMYFILRIIIIYLDELFTKD